MIERERALGNEKRRDDDLGQRSGGDHGILYDDQNGGEWKEVVRKKKKPVQGGRSDVAAVAKFSYNETHSFYFSEFPETHGAKEMLKAFRLYGEAVEVVIPAKRDKWGKRFGFVRFSRVDDLRVFAIKLDNIIFGATKIHVNIPRYRRERAESSNEAGVTHVQAKKMRHPVDQVQVNPHVDHSHGQRKVQQVWRKKETEDDGGRVMGSQQLNRTGRASVEGTGASKIVYEVSEEEIQKFKKMYIGTVRTPGTTYYVQEWFHMQDFFSIKITPMGEKKLVMEEMEEGVFQELLTNYKEWIFEKFDDIRSWDPEVVDNERVVWVRCQGIPLHAWNEDFFASLARTFGDYLGVDEATRTKSAVDIARIRL